MTQPMLPPNTESPLTRLSHSLLNKAVDVIVKQLEHPTERVDLYTVDDLLRPDDEAHNEQVREAYARGVVATAKATSEAI